MNDAQSVSSGDTKRIRILFVCTGNTCRSVLAEYIGRRKFEATIDTASAGIKPQAAADATAAVETLRDIGIDASLHRPRGLEEVDPDSFDQVVAMEPHVAKIFRMRFPAFPLSRLKVWKIDDPWDNPAAYADCAEQVFHELRKFVQKLRIP